MFLSISHSTLASAWLALAISSRTDLRSRTRVEQVQQVEAQQDHVFSHCYFRNLSTSDANMLFVLILNNLKNVPQKYEIFLMKHPVHIFRHKQVSNTDCIVWRKNLSKNQLMYLSHVYDKQQNRKMQNSSLVTVCISRCI